MATPEDKKIDFERLKLFEDVSGSLEPIADGASEQILPEAELEPEATAEEAHVEEEEQAEQAEAIAGEGAEAPAQSKFKGWIKKLSTADPITVLLGLTVAALLIAVLLCLVELGRYGFDIGAKKARSTVTVNASMDLPNSFC